MQYQHKEDFSDRSSTRSSCYVVLLILIILQGYKKYMAKPPKHVAMAALAS